MADERHNQNEKDDAPGALSRRAFVALSVAAGLAAAADVPVTETNVQVQTPDGVCDAVFIHPTTGTHPGVLVWPDAFGLRPTMRDIGKRIAAEGYAVLVPNPFYRVAKAPVIDDPSSFNFQNPTDRAKLAPLMGLINAPGAAEKDAIAFIAFLDAQPQVNKAKKIGTQGYCMGGRLVMRTAAAVPDRVGAGASFHGGGLVTNTPDSPHLLIPKMKARYLIAIAENDDKREPTTKDVLRESFAKAKLPAEIEVYAGTIHGWCPLDAKVYNHDQAEKAWGRMLVLFKSALV